MTTPDARPSRSARPRFGVRPGVVTALLVGGLFAWGAIRIQYVRELAALTPSSRAVTLDVTVVDVDDGRPIAGAEVGLDFSTQDYGHDGPVARARTDAAGRVRFRHTVSAVTRRDRDGQVRGTIRYREDTDVGEPYFLRTTAPGYRESHVWLVDAFPGGTPYEDPSPVPLTIRLRPIPRPEPEP